MAPKRCFWKEFVHLPVAVLSREYEEEWLYHLRKGSYDSDVCFDGFESMIVVFLCHSQVWLTCRARLVLSSLQNTKEGRDRLVRQSHAFQAS